MKRNRKSLKWREVLNVWWVPPAAVLSVALLAAGLILFRPARLPILAASVPACISARANDFQCYKQRYQGLTQQKGPAAAFVDLKAAYATSPFVQSQCHQLTHVIGRQSALQYGNVANAYAHGDNFCWSGYYHGVMETIVQKSSTATVTQHPDSICKPLRDKQKYSFFHYNCVHGLGHGFMEITSDQLFTSLKDCNNLSDSWERESCYGGAFMENIMAKSNPDAHTDYLKADQPMYPCTAVDQPYKQQCYLMQTSYALTLVNRDFSRVFTLCGQVDSAFVDTCYQSLGRDASGSSVSNVQQTRQTCLLGPTDEARDNCAIGAVKDFISYFHSDTQAKQLCDSLPPEQGAVCRSTAKDYYKGF